jgi:formylglycine-generating enzyme required for sulfatase activity
MGLLAFASMAAIGLFADAFWWAHENELPVDAMLTLQCFRTGYAPFPELVSIQAGEFDMGEQDPAYVRNKLSKTIKNEDDIDGMFGIRGQAQVRIEKAFAMGQYEVTYDEYDYYVWRANSEIRQINAQREPIKYPSTAVGGRGAHPVVNITLAEAQAYAEWLGRQTPGQRCSLPTEAEWEYAARAGTETAYWWGNDDVTGRWANFDTGIEGKHNGKAKPVGSYPRNPWHLYDTAGNVHEMTCSAFVKHFDGRTERECELPSGRVSHATRGGSFTAPAVNLRSALRIELQQGLRRDYYGFRVRCDQPMPMTSFIHPCQPTKPASGPMGAIGRP